jgi:cytochrome c
MSKSPKLAILLAALSSLAPAWSATSSPDTTSAGNVGHYGYGQPVSSQDISGWNIAVLPDGTGLPDGHGSVADGGDIFAQQCAACHGTFGEGEGRYPKLASQTPLTGDRPDKTVGNYWPFATTLWDYINRAMPFTAPHSLTPDQVYAVTAYILNLNNVVGDDFVADKATLPKVKMPNRDGFILKDPRPDTSDKDCMSTCRATPAAVTSSAANTGLTPKTTGPLDTALPQ